MASEKFTNLAKRFLDDKTEALANWLEFHDKGIHEEHGDDVMVFIQRGDSLKTDDKDWRYATISFELTYGNEVL